MTLITYLSRVHLADGILEVALSSELELNKLSRPLLVCEQAAVKDEFRERVVAGLHHGCEAKFHDIPANQSAKTTSAQLLTILHETKPDVVVAFGSSLALSVSDSCCRQINAARGDSAEAADIKLIVIPGVDGVPTMSARRNDFTYISGYEVGSRPTAVIIDPTLIIGESIERTSSAIADTFARCLSVHFSECYNPPADGIALDGLKRILRNLDSLMEEDSLDMRRELMAASLNATLAMQDQTGISHELCKILLKESILQIDKGALMRLLILVEAELLERNWTEQRCEEVREALDVPTGTTIRFWISSILETLPLPDSLYELGFKASDITRATQEYSANAAVQHSAQQLEEMLNGIRLGGRILRQAN